MGTQASDRLARGGARALCCLLALVALGWSAMRLRDVAGAGPVGAISTQILAGRPFSREALEAQIPVLQALEQRPTCWPAMWRGSAAIRTSLAEKAVVGGDLAVLDDRLIAARASLRQALTCMPSDAWLWLSLFWVESRMSGITDRAIGFLRLSYTFGSNEGWIAVRRNPLSLLVFERLPEDMQRGVIAEFARMVQSGFFGIAADVLAGPGWPQHEALLAGLAGIDAPSRQMFSEMLRARDIEVTVPGVAASPARR